MKTVAGMIEDKHIPLASCHQPRQTCLVAARLAYRDDLLSYWYGNHLIAMMTQETERIVFTTGASKHWTRRTVAKCDM